MMKKLFILMLVFSMASSAWAFSVWFDGPVSAAPSDTVLISIVTDDPEILGLALDGIGTSMGGTASLVGEPPMYGLNPGFTAFYDPGTPVNAGGLLMEWVYGNVSVVPVTGVLYTFAYHVPEVPFSTNIMIDEFVDAAHWAPYIDSLSGTVYDDIQATIIHVVPEPMTILLLGLGGLFLRRRR